MIQILAKIFKMEERAAAYYGHSTLHLHTRIVMRKLLSSCNFIYLCLFS